MSGHISLLLGRVVFRRIGKIGRIGWIAGRSESMASCRAKVAVFFFGDLGVGQWVYELESDGRTTYKSGDFKMRARRK